MSPGTIAIVVVLAIGAGINGYVTTTGKRLGPYAAPSPRRRIACGLVAAIMAAACIGTLVVGLTA